MLVKKASLIQSHTSVNLMKGSALILIDNMVPDIKSLLEGLPEKVLSGSFKPIKTDYLKFLVPLRNRHHQ